MWISPDKAHLYRAPGAGAATDEVPQVGREDALQDPLLVLPRRPAWAVTAHHAARWKEEQVTKCYGFLDKSQSDSLLEESKIFVLFIDIDNLLWLLSEEIDMRSILRYETQDIFSSRQKILTNQPLKIPRFWRIKTLLYSHQSFISMVAISLSGCCFNRMFQYLYRTISSYIFTHLFAITYLTFIRQEHLMICKNTLYPSILWSSYDFEKVWQ